MKVSVIIPCRNEPTCAEREICDSSGKTTWVYETARHARKSLPNAQIIVVNDASDAGHRRCCDNLVENLGVELLTNRKNLGVAASRNRGIDASSGDTILVLDAHVIPKTPNAYPNLLRHAYEENTFAVCYPYTMGRKTPRNGAHFLFMRDKYLGWQYDAKRDEKSYQIDVPNGGCYAFTRELYNHLQLWPTTSGTFGHNPIAKGLLCYFTDTRAMLYKDAPIYHRYGGIGYSFNTNSQWLNACRLYSVVFAEETFWNIWNPILSGALSTKKIRQIWEHKTTVADREKFAPKKQHSDEEFFRKKLNAPFPRRRIPAFPRIGVVVPAHNEGNYVQQTAHKLKDGSVYDTHVIIVDDKSAKHPKLRNPQALPAKIPQQTRDEFLLEAANAAPEKTRKREQAGNRIGPFFLPQNRRRGVAFCRNKGAQFCSQVLNFEHTDVLLFSDAHTFWDEGAVQILAESAIQTSGVVAASFGNWRTNPQDAEKRKVYGADLVMRKERGLGAAYRRVDPVTNLSRVPHIIGSAYAMTVETYKKLGGWVEVPGCFWGCAEALLQRKAWLLGIPLFVNKCAFVRHHLSDGLDIPTQGYLAAIHLLHTLGLPPEIGDALVARVPFLREYTQTIEEAEFVLESEKWLVKNQVVGGWDFVEEFLPEFLETS